MAKNVPLNFEQYGGSLPGEDRSFGGNSYYADPIPSSAWFVNLRTAIPASQWKELSAYVRHRHQDRCEMCGSDKRVEAHERWLFDKKTQTQKLMRIMCLCKMCHLSVHIGVTSKLGFREEFREEIENHIFSITGWKKNDLSKHLKEARDKGETLSRTSWNMNVSIARNAGITVHDPDTIRGNVAVKETALAQERSKSVILDAFAGDGVGDGNHCVLELLRKGLVVTLPKTDADRLAGMPLSNLSLCIAKHPSKVGENEIHIPLPAFIKAHNNPITVQYKKDIKQVLIDDPDSPRRLIVRRSWVTDKLIEDCFKKAILFSFE